MTEVILDALLDSLRLVPFLFLTYLAMGILERASGHRTKEIIREAGKLGPVWGSLLGAFPQCGFSAAASYFYMNRVVTLGTLVAVYMSTSDEMLPILISEKVEISTIVKILALKVIIAVISGFLIEFLFGWLARRHKMPKEFEMPAESCSCGGSILIDAVTHTLKVFFFIFVISLVIGSAIALIGEGSLYRLFSDVPVLGQAVAALVGLIPNCAASVAITQLYLDGIIGTGPMFSGLLVSAGMGLLVLFKENRHIHENFIIAALLYAAGVVWGVVIEFLGITF